MNLLFAQKLFDTLINYNYRVVITFKYTYKEFYFYMNIFQTGGDRSAWTKPILQASKIKLSYIVKTLLNVALRKMEVTDRLFLRVILTSKNEKLFESSVSKVNFIFLCFKGKFYIRKTN